MDKKIIATLSLFFLTFFSFCQSINHIDFEGVPVDGTFDVFVPKMLINDYRFDEFYGDIAVFKGKYNGQKCSVGAVAESESGVVHMVGVIFESHYSWTQIYKDYIKHKKYLAEKYGEPSEVFEEFAGEEPKNDSDRMYKLINDSCLFACSWVLENGVIVMSIESEDYFNNHVIITYIDSANTKKVATEEEKILR